MIGQLLVFRCGKAAGPRRGILRIPDDATEPGRTPLAVAVLALKAASRSALRPTPAALMLADSSAGGGAAGERNAPAERGPGVRARRSFRVARPRRFRRPHRFDD